MNKQQLASKIWAAANEMRSKIEASEYKDYILGFIFYKFLSEQEETYLKKEGAIGVRRTDAKIEAVQVSGVGKNFELEADYFIDATGDANLFAFANEEFVLGRESDDKTQPMTLCFRMSNVNVKDFYGCDLKNLQKLWTEKRLKGEIKNPLCKIMAFKNVVPDVLHLNSTRVKDKSPVDPFEKSAAEIEARKQAVELFEFLKENAPSCKDAYLTETASTIGVRESRKIKGLYTITKEDILSLKKFDDAVGRCISSTQIAQSAFRVMPIVANIGEGGGVCLAYVAKNKLPLKAVSAKDVKRLIKKYDLIF